MKLHETPKAFDSYFLRTAVLRKLFDIKLSYKLSKFSHGCLLVKMASKTVTRYCSGESLERIGEPPSGS